MPHPVWFLLLLLPLWAPAPVGAVEDDDDKIRKVEVVNLPSTQSISGSVSVNGRLSHSKMERYQGVIAPVLSRNDPRNLQRLGVLEVDGFTSIIVSLQGESRNNYQFSPGSAGVLLIPEEATILEAFLDKRQPLFAFEVESTFSQANFPYFASKSEKFTVAFPRYGIYLYNSSSSSVEANLYIYLTN